MSSPAPKYEIAATADEAAPADPAYHDGSIDLTQRARLQLLFNEPAVRNYVIAAFSALAMIFLVLFQQGSDLGGLLIVIIGVSGVVLRWTAAPAFVLFVLTYFMVFPFGIPGEAFENRWEIEDGRFRPTDLVLAMAVMVYMAAQFRIFGFVHQAIAVEGAVRRQDEPVTRRPPGAISNGEIGTLLLVSFVIVIGAQLLWWVINSLEVTPTDDVPFRWSTNSRSFRRTVESGGLTPGLTRFVVMIGLMGFGVMLGRLVFGYWRLRNLRADEGAMILLDDSWLETKRERSRQEKWRRWGMEQAKARAAEEAGPAKKGSKA
ncbi:MAG: hypothetical protein C0467_18455 [Planctomycetaceae bacterium]|nr:hypothetical protein [Planctomycetaceae bacterium]